jgi:hypothetical protein
LVKLSGRDEDFSRCPDDDARDQQSLITFCLMGSIFTDQIFQARFSHNNLLKVLPHQLITLKVVQRHDVSCSSLPEEEGEISDVVPRAITEIVMAQLLLR